MLQRHGWSFAVDYEPMSDAYKLALYHKDYELYGLTNARHIPKLQNMQHGYSMLPTFKMVALARRLESKFVEVDFERFNPVCMTPTIANVPVKNIEDFNIFNVVPRAKQIMVDKADMTVIEHLEAIKNLQSTKQRELRAKELDVTERRSRIHLVTNLIHMGDAA